MEFSPALAEIRFGLGRGPSVASPQAIRDMLKGLRGVDPVLRELGTAPFALRYRQVRDMLKARRMRAESTAAQEIFSQKYNELRSEAQADLGRSLIRAAQAPSGFRERLVWFWADHFTVAAPNPYLKATLLPYIDEAIRPHIASSFSKMLVAVATHPAMIHYLDQQASFGPNSPRVAARKSGGLNENLAREILELHTLGVDGSYGQADVRNLAVGLTGLAISKKGTLDFRHQIAEPGTWQVLGRDYGRARPRLGDIQRVLGDLAVHPETAHHICRKLAVHFVADAPSQALVSQMSEAFLARGGRLMDVYAALLEHPDAWALPCTKVRQPFEFMCATARGLGLGKADLTFTTGFVRRNLHEPLRLMGQPWFEAPGPDGWPETAEAWITPQALAARIDWSMNVPRLLRPHLPDPRKFLDETLGEFATPQLVFAAQAAETRAAGVGLILSSPEFQRR